jgi:hypothetical protein
MLKLFLIANLFSRRSTENTIDPVCKHENARCSSDWATTWYASLHLWCGDGTLLAKRVDTIIITEYLR